MADPATDTLSTALSFLEKGFSVIFANGKVPAYPWQEYQTRCATPDELEQRYRPNSNVGIVTGAISGLTVIDADTQEAINQIEECLPENYVGPIATTPRGGKHYYFKHQEDLHTCAAILQNIDVRAEGGYAVAPPSTNGNGKRYQWLDGLSIFEVDPPEMPGALVSLFNKALFNNNNVIYNSFSLYTHSKDVRKNDDLTKPYKTLQFLTLGTRDNDLFHVGNCLIKGGCEPDKALQVLEILAKSCDPPFPEKEVTTKIKSVLSRCERRERNLTEDLRKWIDLTSAYFSLTETYDPLQILTSQKNTVHQIMHRLVKEGYVERHPNKNGVYRRVDQTIEFMDFADADPNDTIDLRMPLDIHKKTVTYPKSAIPVMGVSGTAKSTFVFNVIRENFNLMPVFYFNSEMGPQQLKKKLSFFPTPMDVWTSKMKVVDNWDFNNIADKVQPDGLNVIDYLEPEGDKPYMIHGVISAIIKRLNRGIALICIQKRPDAKLGTGGIYSIKAASLALALDWGRIEIVKNRNREADQNPSLTVINFDILHGYQFKARGGWYAPEAR